MSQIIWRGTTWTYGNWGGKGWSAGQFTPKGEKVDRDVEAQDDLDQVFKDHDINYEDAEERWKESPQSREDRRNYWNDIIAADEQMIRDIRELRDSGALGEPPSMSSELTYQEASPAWYAAQQAQLAFETAVAAHMRLRVRPARLQDSVNVSVDLVCPCNHHLQGDAAQTSGQQHSAKRHAGSP